MTNQTNTPPLVSTIPDIPLAPMSVQLGSIKLSMIQHAMSQPGVSLNSLEGSQYIANMVSEQVKHGFTQHGCVNPTFCIYMLSECNCHDIVIIGGGELNTPITELTDLAKVIVEDCNAFCVVTLGEIRKFKSSHTRNKKTINKYQEAVCIQVEHLFQDYKLIADFDRYTFDEYILVDGNHEKKQMPKWSINEFKPQVNKTPVNECIGGVLNGSRIFEHIEVV